MLNRFASTAAVMATSAMVLSSPMSFAQAAKGSVVVGWESTIDTLNPAATALRDVAPITNNIFDTLVWVTPEFKVTPHLATNWNISDDGKTYTFKLRNGVTFHDGTPFNASAVIANFEYIANKDTKARSAIPALGPCLTAKEVDEFTVQVSCSEPYAPLLTQLGLPYLGIQSPAAIKKYGAELGLHPTGTGPFVFYSYKPNESVVLTRNEKYDWSPPALKVKGPPQIASLTFQIVPNAQSRVSQFMAGQSQVMNRTPGVFWNSLKNNSKFTQIPVPVTGLGIFVELNAGRFPTDDLAVRKAIQHSVDKKGVVQLAEVGAFPITSSPISKGMVGYDASLESSYPYDPKKAAALLTEAGWKKSGEFWEKDGKRLTLKLTVISTRPGYVRIAEAIQEYLRKAGMDVQVEQQALPAWFAGGINGDFSLTPMQLVGTDPSVLNGLFMPGAYMYWNKYTNAELQDLLSQGQTEMDENARAQTYKKAQKLVVDSGVLMPIHQNIDLVTVTSKLRGVTYSAGGFEYFGAATLAD
ncbi:ABC transporter substrate-binding protein [Bradyrhizobium diazoefficiens]|uniref:ABC transporter substrate-binding protein n=1 Tax=Bradyrhizobium diazoefficiens TaxID=1355477 RepID=UPI001AED55C9|nr:ABC transporter substrate-binding protein [Bradyrhizobium diazoefficiens]